MSRTNSVHGLKRKQWFGLLIMVFALYVLLPQLSFFRHSFQAVLHAQPSDLLIAGVFTFLTFFAAAATYGLLAVIKLHYLRTVFVELASMFTNRLLPAGLGGIGVNYAYLRKEHHTPAQAASVAAANNLLGFIGHIALFGIILLINGGHLPQFKLTHQLSHGNYLVLIVLICCAVLMVVFRHFRARVSRGINGVFHQLLAYRHRPLHLASACVTSMSLTLCNVLSLYFCVQALHIQLPFFAVLVIFTLGIALGTATPTPGGLGGTEAGLFVGLTAYHISSADALAAALTYRLISFWLTLVVSAGTFVVAERRGYFYLK